MIKQESKKLEILKGLFADSKITYWVKDFGVRCHIFTIQIDSEMHLKEIWESLTDRIAIDFQADFENEFESWNVYVVFLSESEISRGLKYKIENDKYSSRKIVMDEISSPINEDEIIERISKRIFQLDIFADKPHDDIQQDLSQIIDKTLYSHIYNVNLEGRTKPVLEKRERVFKNIYKEYANEI